ncbi:hypothetical protein L3i22_061080 [Actinoplanes sp. L3-i22]|nr:hypothetical protein L3i22_061080 [Actinoplanes sp. L3-i22]
MFAATCPTYCTRKHDEEPGEVIVHESTPVLISQLSAPRPGRPLALQVSEASDDPTVRLHLNAYEFGLEAAETLLRALTAKVELMRAAQKGPQNAAGPDSK